MHLLRGNHEEPDIWRLSASASSRQRLGKPRVTRCGDVSTICSSGYPSQPSSKTASAACTAASVSLTHISQINDLKRPLNMENGGVELMDILWSDPTENDGVEGLRPNARGPGLVTFGPDRVKAFCETNGIHMIIRAHECVMDGFERFAQGQLLTVFSATNYWHRKQRRRNLGLRARPHALSQAHSPAPSDRHGVSIALGSHRRQPLVTRRQPRQTAHASARSSGPDPTHRPHQSDVSAHTRPSRSNVRSFVSLFVNTIACASSSRLQRADFLSSPPISPASPRTPRSPSLATPARPWPRTASPTRSPIDVHRPPRSPAAPSPCSHANTASVVSGDSVVARLSALAHVSAHSIGLDSVSDCFSRIFANVSGVSAHTYRVNVARLSDGVSSTRAPPRPSLSCAYSNDAREHAVRRTVRGVSAHVQRDDRRRARHGGGSTARGPVPMERNLRRDAHASSVVSRAHEAFKSRRTSTNASVHRFARRSRLCASRDARADDRAKGRSRRLRPLCRNRATRASPDDGDDDALARDLFRSICDAVRATNAREGMRAEWARDGRDWIVMKTFRESARRVAASDDDANACSTQGVADYAEVDDVLGAEGACARDESETGANGGGRRRPDGEARRRNPRLTSVPDIVRWTTKRPSIRRRCARF